ncbi:MAG: XdhC/CoxI family protein [Thermodesulfobacteriota bacterium]|nr:XdhC/CoxI family protein [Thermodesulfobacteriota bacterium]
MEDIYQEIIKIKSEGGNAAVATIISIKGSTPREVGSKMLIRSDASILGSIGGGNLEALVLEEAQKVMREGKSKVLHFDLTGKESPDAETIETGMICGGISDILIEPIFSEPTLYIFGAGHISLYLSRIGKMVGFKVVVADDREEFANRERFPEADEVFAENFGGLFKRLEPVKPYYIVIVTRGHKYDQDTLEWAMGTEPKYVGMIGSRAKNRTVLSNLQKKGIPGEQLERVHAPIGLDIGSETPEEIAISIIAEIIQVRREGKTAGPKTTCET